MEDTINPKRPVLLIVMAVVTAAFLLLPSAGQAQEDPLPIAEPAYFRGSVTINGEAAPDGTPIEALIEETVCGTTTTSEGRYSITVNTNVGEGIEFQKGCGLGGDDVLFRSGELLAAERGTFLHGIIEDLDLNFGIVASPTVPPQFPDTGSGVAGGSGTPAPPWLLWALVLTGIAAVGAAAIARRAKAQG